MRIKYFMAVILMIAIFLSACSRHSVLLESTNAKGEVPQLGNLVFRFNQSLYPDSLLNNWDSTEYISFEPRIPGRFRWNGPDELVFSPAEPLLPATSYTAKIRNEVLRFSKFNDVKDEDRIAFHTAPLQLNDARVIWVLSGENSRTAVPQLHLYFNYPVKAEDVKDKLAIEVEGKKAEYGLNSSGITSEVIVQLKGFHAEDKNYEAQVKLEKGLKPEKGDNRTADAIETALSIPSPFVLNITNVESEHDGTQGIVHLYTSQQLNGEDVSRYIQFEPAVPFTVDYEDDGITLRSEKFNPENSYTLTVNTGLRGRIGGVLKEPFSQGLASVSWNPK